MKKGINIDTPDNVIKNMVNSLGSRGKLAFVSTFIVGLLTHLVIMTSDIPNHDGLDSMYFDQNMITSGRWFLQAVCGISSYFSLPWLIAVLSIIYISISSALVVNLLNIRNKAFIVLTGAFLVTFPAIASNFAYVFTMDGYMLGLLLCIAAVAVTKKYKFGFVPGGIILAFGIGVYQSYLCVAMLLCLYLTAVNFTENKKKSEKAVCVGKYAAMGVIGLGLYYAILNILLRVEGKVLGEYQGINDMADVSDAGFVGTVKEILNDFLSFSLYGKVFIPNKICLYAFGFMCVAAVTAFVFLIIKEKWYKKISFYVLTVILVGLIPFVVNAILFISTDVTYHLLMRYTWGFLPVVLLAFTDLCTDYVTKANLKNILLWVVCLSGTVIAFCYALTDNIAYSNMEKKYEKTYAYCIRLADRIEETPGYYEGIPIAMVGVVGDVNFPLTDITGDVTGNIIGAGGDYLLYKGENYQLFFKYYLGISYNILSEEHVADFYYMDEYVKMPSFPDEGSTRVIDGVLYVKTENATY